VDDRGLHPHQVADVDGLVEADAAHVHGYAIGAGPRAGTGVGRLVDPLHHRAAVHLAPEVHVRGLADELEGDLVVGVHGGGAKDRWAVTIVDRTVKSTLEQGRVACA